MGGVVRWCVLLVVIRDGVGWVRGVVCWCASAGVCVYRVYVVIFSYTSTCSTAVLFKMLLQCPKYHSKAGTVQQPRFKPSLCDSHERCLWRGVRECEYVCAYYLGILQQ